jgi:signal transduction histidine kinase
MRISILQKLIIFSLVILAGNGILAYMVYKSNQKLSDSEKWVQQTEQIIFQSEEILSMGKDIESASRGFMLTNDSNYLEPLNTSKVSIIGQIASLRNLVQNNQKQEQRVDSLNFYMNKRLEFSLMTVDLRSKFGLNTAITLVSTNLGKLYSDKMRNIIYEIQKEETEMLNSRKLANEQISDSYNKFTVVIFVLMTSFTILLVIATGRNMIKNKEKERQEVELQLTNKELDFQSHENEKQIAANKELESFSYSVSHDLRAPLRHITGFIDLLSKNSAAQLDENGKRYLKIISESAHEMGDLIDALLTFSRLSRTEMQRTPINTRSMVNHIVKTFKTDMAGRNVELNLSNLPDIMGDETLIHQVWVNLISNALKYTRNKEKAIIEIGGKSENGSIIFHTKDNGVGFDMKYSDKLFGVFQRLHKARDFEGVGIGLANVNRIVTRHGGKCWAESEVDKGATFFFSIPNN